MHYTILFHVPPKKLDELLANTKSLGIPAPTIARVDHDIPEAPVTGRGLLLKCLGQENRVYTFREVEDYFKARGRTGIAPYLAHASRTGDIVKLGHGKYTLSPKAA